MEKLEKTLESLKLEMKEMQDAWAKEVKQIADQKGFDAYSKKAEKEFNKIADRYAAQMTDNLFAQNEIEIKLAKLKEEERKKQYKD